MASWIRQKDIESNVSDATGLKNLLESALKEQIDALENLGKKDEAWLWQEIRCGISLPMKGYIPRSCSKK
jgi:hypothetical protein